MGYSQKNWVGPLLKTLTIFKSKINFFFVFCYNFSYPSKALTKNVIPYLSADPYINTPAVSDLTTFKNFFYTQHNQVICDVIAGAWGKKC